MSSLPDGQSVISGLGSEPHCPTSLQIIWHGRAVANTAVAITSPADVTVDRNTILYREQCTKTWVPSGGMIYFHDVQNNLVSLDFGLPMVPDTTGGNTATGQFTISGAASALIM